MKTPRPRLAALAASLLAALFLLAPAGAAQGLDIGQDVDASIRWLRSVQAADGSYGGGVAGSAWALRAYAECHRAYGAQDGPFVRGALDFLVLRQQEDGAICDRDAAGDARAAQTRAAVASLFLVQSSVDHKRALARAVSFLGDAGLEGEAWQPIEAPEEAAAARARAVELLGKRRDDGAWDGPRGRVIETAAAIVELERLDAVLAPPKSDARRDATALPRFGEADREAAAAAILRGARFLIAASDDGLWGAPGQPDAGLSAMAIGALQAVPEPRPKDVQAAIDRGVAWLVRHQDADGSIHDGKLKNYITSASVLAIARTGEEQYAPVLEKARAFLVALQADEGEGYSEGDLYYGGIGYGGDERPDLSNLQMALEALSAAGMQKGDPTYLRALKFLERCQNRSESNDIELSVDGVVIKSGDDGGSGYMPGDSKAGYEVLADGTRVPRSYGSMTYALLKGFVFAGLPKEDPRMRAAWKWVSEHYTLDVNPGFEHSQDPTAPYQGLFYYFHSMARALELYGEEYVVDARGLAHPWRRQLSGRLIAMQRKDDGSWVNENASRWWEGNPVLATSYALLALDAALPGAED